MPREKPSARLYRACTLTGVPPFAALATMPRRTSSLAWFAWRRNPRLAVVPVRVLAAAAAVPVVGAAPIRERRRGAAAAHTLVVVAPVAAHVVIFHRCHVLTYLIT